ncbi:MAG: RsmE family RNA methyltransferase [Candidatus Omnitrophota bacterium]
MSQFFAESKNINSNLILITDPKEIAHIIKSRRYNLGDKINLFDEKRNSYAGIIDKINEDEIVVKIVETHCNASLQTSELTIACALPKNAKFEYIVEKLAELGVFRIIPIVTERTIVRLSVDKVRQKAERFRKIAREAAKQSSNPIITKIDEIKFFKDIFDEKYDLIIIPTLEGKRVTFKDAICSVGTGPCACPKILALIGPEGDFTKEEVEFAIKHGSKPVTLGKRILKVDTAAIFVAVGVNLCVRP